MLLTINYEPPPPHWRSKSLRICLLRIGVGGGELHNFIKGRRGEIRAGRLGYGRDFSTEVKENDIYLIFVNLKKSDKPTDGQTLWLNFQKNSEHFGNS